MKEPFIPKWPGAYLTEDGTQWVLPGFSKWWREIQSSTALVRLVDCPQFWEWYIGARFKGFCGGSGIVVKSAFTALIHLSLARVFYASYKEFDLLVEGTKALSYNKFV